MRAQIIGFVIAAVTGAMASGQPAPQGTVLHLANGQTAQNLQEIATTIRTVGDIRQVSVDTAKIAVTVGGTADQIDFARWLMKELDKPAGPHPASSAAHEYRMRGSGDDVVRVFYLTNSQTPQSLQEIMTSIRSIADISPLFAYNAQRALTVRGTATQISLAEWLVDELDKPANTESVPAGPREYRMPDASGDLVRVFYLTHVQTPQDLQNVASAVRAATKIERLFVNNAQRALAARGMADQIAAAEGLISGAR